VVVVDVVVVDVDVVDVDVVDVDVADAVEVVASTVDSSSVRATDDVPQAAASSTESDATTPHRAVRGTCIPSGLHPAVVRWWHPHPEIVGERQR
jgi:hypothetical protein